jgi:hypothetical protein
MQLVVTIHDMLQSFDKGKQVDIVILDFSKAFDTVPYDRLLHQIDQYGQSLVGHLCGIRIVLVPALFPVVFRSQLWPRQSIRLQVPLTFSFLLGRL